MRNSNDIINYFRRSVKRKELRQRKKKGTPLSRLLLREISALKYELQRKEDWASLYSELIAGLQNVSKYCALRNPEIMRVAYPLERFITYEMGTYRPSHNSSLLRSHALNIYYAEILIKDYVVEDLIHFRMQTAEGIYGYQYSKQGLAIQSFERLLKEVTWMITKAWFKSIHEKENNHGIR